MNGFSLDFWTMRLLAACLGLAVWTWSPGAMAYGVKRSAEDCYHALTDAQRKLQVIQGIRALLAYNQTAPADQKISLNFNQLRQDRSERTSRVLKEAGSPIPTGAILHRRALSLFGNSWDQALEIAGENPAQIRKETKILTTEKLLKVLKDIDQAGVNLQANRFRQDSSERTREIIFKSLGETFSPWTIHEVARQKYGGDWYAALVAAGVNAQAHRSDYNLHVAVNETNVGGLLRALDSAGVDLSSSGFEADTSENTAQIIQLILGKPIKPSTVIAYVRDLYSGDWYLALQENGVDASKHRRNHRWSRGELLRAGRMILRAQQGESLDQLIAEEFGGSVTPAAIRRAVSRAPYVENLSELAEYVALRDQVRPTRWTEDMIRKALRALYEADFLPNSSLLQNTSGNMRLEIETMKILFQATGHRTTTRSLIGAIERTYGGGLDEALQKAGLDPDEIRLREKKFSWKTDPLAIPMALLALHNAGISPVRSTLETDDPALKEGIANFLEKHLGQRVYPGSLMQAIRVYYPGGIEAALRRAGLDPQEVQNVHQMDWSLDLEKIKSVALRLRELGYTPSIELFLSGNEKILEDIQAVLLQVYGRPLYALDYVRAMNQFFEGNLTDSPENWSLRPRGGSKPFAHYRISSLPFQTEYARNSEPGQVFGGRLVGRQRELAPDEALIQSEDSLRRTLSSQNPDQSSLLELILLAVDMIPDNEITPQRISRELRERGHGVHSVREIEALFNAIRDNPILAGSVE